MGKIVLLAPLAGVLLGGAAHALPQNDQDQMKANYEEKLHKEFISYGGWITDYDQARELAAKEKKFIFAYFTRSYAK